LKRAVLSIVLILIVGSICAPTWAAVPTEGTEAVAAGEEDAQLRVLRTALLQGPTFQSRVDAAMVLLSRSDTAARGILVAALLAEDNTEARQAVCRGLIRSRGLVEVTGRPEVFLEPLMGLLLSESTEEVHLAAEALLVFDFERVGPRLRQWATSEKLETRVRLNVIHALSLWPEKQAIETLIQLVDDRDSEVAGRAQAALHEAFGIPAGTDLQTFRGILQQIQGKSAAQIIRDLMAAQRERVAVRSEQMRRVTAERDLWRTKYLAALDREYVRQDEGGKAKMLVDKLGSEWSAEKLWALGKVGGYPGSVPQELRALLLASVVDADRRVRLAAANVLAGKSALDPAAVLLKQLEVETDREVAMAIFDALGEACFFAFSPGSPIKLDTAIRDRVLALAAEYVNGSDSTAAIHGIEVLGKLVGLDGLTAEAVEHYAELLAKAYAAAAKAEKPGRQQETYKVALMNAMAQLAERSKVRPAAGRLFRPLFEAALGPETTNGLRQAAARGLLNVDTAAALALFRQKGLAKDKSAAVRRVVIEAAAQVGGMDDLAWLKAALDVEADSEAAWQAIRGILGRQKAEAILAWAEEVAGQGDRYREVLALADTRAQAENQRATQMRVRLALMQAHLEAGDVTKASATFAWWLLQQADITADDPFVKAAEQWLARPDVAAEKKTALIDALAGVKRPDQAQWTQWMAKLKDWQSRFKPGAAAKPAGRSAGGSPGPSMSRPAGAALLS